MEGEGTGAYISSPHVINLVKEKEVPLDNALEVVRLNMDSTVDGSVAKITLSDNREYLYDFSEENYGSDLNTEVGYGLRTHYDIENDTVVAYVDLCVSPTIFVGCLKLTYTFTGDAYKATSIDYLRDSYMLYTLENLVPENPPENMESPPPYPIIEDHTFSVFEGRAGDSMIRMMISRSGTKLTAYYVTQQDNEKEIILDGSYNHVTGTVTLSNTEQNIIFDGYTRTTQTEGEGLEGNCSFDGNSMDFSLLLTHGFVQTESHDKLYEDEETMGFNTAKVEALAELIKKYVNGDEKEKLAELIDYPVNINIRGSHFLINGKEEFVQRYDDIFDSAFKKKIVTAFSKYMSANYMGVSFAEGSILIYQYEAGGSPKIIAISNGATYWDPENPTITKE